MQKGSKSGRPGDLEPHTQRRPKKDGARPLRGPRAAPFWEPDGSPIEAKWRQNGNQKCIEF